MSETNSVVTLVDEDLKELKKSDGLLEEPVLLVTRLKVQGW